MVRMWETTDSFPFRTLRGVGGTLLGFGISLIILGAFDVIWTVIKYSGQYDDCDNLDWDPELDNPCEHDDLLWTWTSEGVWGGFLILVVGVLGLIFSRWRIRSLRLQRDMFGIGCILLIFPICPAIIALSVLELYYGLDLFYYTEDNSLVREDIAKFIVPLLTGFLAFLAWLIAIAGASVACCCAKISVSETVYAKSPTVMAAPAAQPIIMAPQQKQPQILQIAAPEPAQPQYEVVAIAQPAPPPYFVSAPMGMPPPGMRGPPPPPGMFGPPPMMGPLPPPHMMGPPPFRGPRGRFGPPLPMLPPPEAYL